MTSSTLLGLSAVLFVSACTVAPTDAESSSAAVEGAPSSELDWDAPIDTRGYERTIKELPRVTVEVHFGVTMYVADETTDYAFVSKPIVNGAIAADLPYGTLGIQCRVSGAKGGPLKGGGVARVFDTMSSFNNYGHAMEAAVWLRVAENAAGVKEIYCAKRVSGKDQTAIPTLSFREVRDTLWNQNTGALLALEAL